MDPGNSRARSSRKGGFPRLTAARKQFIERFLLETIQDELRGAVNVTWRNNLLRELNRVRGDNSLEIQDLDLQHWLSTNQLLKPLADELQTLHADDNDDSEDEAAVAGDVNREEQAEDNGSHDNSEDASNEIDEVGEDGGNEEDMEMVSSDESHSQQRAWGSSPNVDVFSSNSSVVTSCDGSIAARVHAMIQGGQREQRDQGNSSQENPMERQPSTSTAAGRRTAPVPVPQNGNVEQPEGNPWRNLSPEEKQVLRTRLNNLRELVRMILEEVDRMEAQGLQDENVEAFRSMIQICSVFMKGRMDPDTEQ